MAAGDSAAQTAQYDAGMRQFSNNPPRL